MLRTGAGGHDSRDVPLSKQSVAAKDGVEDALLSDTVYSCQYIVEDNNGSAREECACERLSSLAVLDASHLTCTHHSHALATTEVRTTRAYFTGITIGQSVKIG